MLRLVSYFLLILAECSSDPFDYCETYPCGLNAHCMVSKGTVHCTCLPGFKGTPPYCERINSTRCIDNSECDKSLACANKRCVDPCIGSCGLRARCVVIKHNPVCSCEVGYTGDPFLECRPKCASNSECRPPLVCVENRCVNPCGGDCRADEDCQRAENGPICVCRLDFTGLSKYPYSTCQPIETVAVQYDSVVDSSSSSSEVAEQYDSVVDSSSSSSEVAEQYDSVVNSSSSSSLSDTNTDSSGPPPGADELSIIIGCSVAFILNISVIAAVIVWRMRKRNLARVREVSDPIYEEIYEAASFAGASSVPEVAALPPCPPPREAGASSEPEIAARPACPLPKEAVWQENVYDIVYETRVQRLWESRWFAFVRSERRAEVRRLAASMPRPRD